MKIIDYKLEIYKEILDRPLGDSNGPSGNDLIYSSILKIETDEDIANYFIICIRFIILSVHIFSI